ncbi:relaxase/mobilization nuclease domain-containing protein [Pseudomonas izuensis]|uniref:MobA/VirD2-like nuclease domain-containing protein n=1 Tax=Pseudomonas izuensis TaxID=2684212 RepID=A0ABM7RNK2_9PSED|nr:relaxase/mobilization nuclease domain-containing protein [Pseudomonas izuensis]BCX67225.1 hypothetical protein LAB08_R18590 [Pseudomonas izuensis]
MTIGRKFKNETNSSRTRVKYVFGINHEHKCEHAKFLGGNVTTVAGIGKPLEDLIDSLVEEMDSPSTIRAGLLGKGPGMCHTHYAVSIAPGEHLDLPDWRNVAIEVMEALGYNQNYKWFAQLHEDTDKEHIHILGNRTSMETGYLLDEGNDYRKMMEVLRLIEIKYGLQITAMPEDTWGIQLRETEIGPIMRSENPEPHWKHALIARIANAVEKTTVNNGNIVDFVKHLKKSGVGVEFSIKDGDIVGISYDFKKNKISGRKLKRSRCTFQALTINEGILYDKILIPSIQKFAKTRDEKSHKREREREEIYNGARKAIDYRIKYELSYDAVKKSTAYKSKNGYFAIRVEADKFRRPMIASRITPSRVLDNNFFFSFQKPTREEITWDQYRRLVESVMASAFNMMQEVLTGIKYKIETEMDFIATEEDGPRYKISDKSPQNNSLQYSMRLPINL